MTGAEFFLVMLVCARDLDTGRFTRDCAPVESAEPATWADCNATARHHRETAPAGLRVIEHACVRTIDRKPMVANR